jgi:hypothetical protein
MAAKGEKSVSEELFWGITGFAIILGAIALIGEVVA